MRDGRYSKTRLIIQDKTSGARFLVDMRADLSVLPRGWRVHGQPSTTLKLFATNGSVIPTFGKRKLYLNLGLRRDFVWTFVVANVAQPIIGRLPQTFRIVGRH